MKLVNITLGEKVYTLELSESELNTITTCLWGFYKEGKIGLDAHILYSNIIEAQKRHS